MSEKITGPHLERAAYVYVRQSTMHQVREHQESQRRQYELMDKARQLKFPDVVVIDEDLGRSGTGSQERPGFGKLLAAVCEGRVGGVFAMEASRLARNNRDWHHLIDLCALTNTVVIDHDGVYDPRNLNDRLLLGLKGSMAEFRAGAIAAARARSLAGDDRAWGGPVGGCRRARADRGEWHRDDCRSPGPGGDRGSLRQVSRVGDGTTGLAVVSAREDPSSALGKGQLRQGHCLAIADLQPDPEFPRRIRSMPEHSRMVAPQRGWRSRRDALERPTGIVFRSKSGRC